MKKLFLFVIAALCLASCGEESSVTGGGDIIPTTPTESNSSTKVYVQGEDLSSSYTTPESYAPAWSTRALAAQTETAHFFLRIDNRIPDKDGNYSYPSNLYWPKKAGNTGDVTVIAKGNEGTIDMAYPYWTINGSKRYIYDSSGMSVTNALLSIPSWTDLLAANEDHSYGIENIDFTKYKIIWYVIKKEGNGWHVDGVLTTRDITDVRDTGINIDEDKTMENSKREDVEESADNGNVEVDIHQQLHKDWSEIKTSIHVRDLVDKVTVEIPIERDNMVPADDFAIRSYDYNIGEKIYIKGQEYNLATGNPLNVSVEHQATKIVITISSINHEYIKKLMEVYGDGITIEIHSYPQNLANNGIWNKMYDVAAKMTKCSVSVESASYDTNKIKLTTSRYAATEETTEE